MKMQNRKNSGRTTMKSWTHSAWHIDRGGCHTARLMELAFLPYRTVCYACPSITFTQLNSMSLPQHQHTAQRTQDANSLGPAFKFPEYSVSYWRDRRRSIPAKSFRSRLRRVLRSAQNSSSSYPSTTSHPFLSRPASGRHTTWANRQKTSATPTTGLPRSKDGGQEARSSCSNSTRVSYILRAVT